MHLGELRVKKKHIKKAHQDVVSVGFPKSALERWAGERKVEVAENHVTIFLSESDNTPSQGFESWKGSIITESNEYEKQDVTDEICGKILSFQIENKTPMECMIFISHLKNLLIEKNN